MSRGRCSTWFKQAASSAEGAAYAQCSVPQVLRHQSFQQGTQPEPGKSRSEPRTKHNQAQNQGTREEPCTKSGGLSDLQRCLKPPALTGAPNQSVWLFLCMPALGGA